MQTRSGFQLLARCGYVARGTVFILLAGLALVTGATDTKSAIDSLLAKPFGQVWVCLIGLGLVGFVIWRLAQSIGNADGEDSDLKGFAVRVMLLGSAVVYVGLAYYSFDHALGFGTTTNASWEKDIAAWAMAQPFGKYLAALIGIGFVIGGAVTIAKGVLAKYERYMHGDVKGSKLIRIVCLYGLTARGVLFVIAGAFFVFAAFSVDPDEAGSMADALAWIRQLPFGAPLYGLAAVGLLAFGAYNFIEGKYRIVRVPDLAGKT